MELTMDILRKLCEERNVIFSLHVLKRLQERGILREDVIQAIHTGEIIEQYPSDFPYPSCLVMGYTIENELLHVVCGCNWEIVKIVTAYRPTTAKFEADLKTRKE